MSKTMKGDSKELWENNKRIPSEYLGGRKRRNGAEKLIEYTRAMWWSISCVNLTGLMDTQITIKTLFPGVSPGVLPEEISIWIGWRRREEHPHQCGRAPSNLFRTWIKQEGEQRMNLLSFPELRNPSSTDLGHQCFQFSGCQTGTVTYSMSPPFPGVQRCTELYRQLSWFSSLQEAYCEASQAP